MPHGRLFRPCRGSRVCLMPDEPPPPPAIPVASAHPAEIDSDGEGIYCPLCNYNLTGAMAGRCPECGAFFDRDALMTAQRTNRVTLIPWDSPEPMPFSKRLASTLRICLFKPDRFAFAFSVQPQKTSAGWFMALVILVTVFGCAAAVLINASLDAGDELWDTDSAPLMILALSLSLPMLIVGTTFCAALLLGASCPHYDGKRHLKPRLSVCAYASAHYLMLLVVVVPFAFVAPLLDVMDLPIAGSLACVACSILCAFTLTDVVKHRTARHRRSSLTGPLLIAIYGIGTIMALFISIPLADFLIRMGRV